MSLDGPAPLDGPSIHLPTSACVLQFWFDFERERQSERERERATERKRKRKREGDKERKEGGEREGRRDDDRAEGLGYRAGGGMPLCVSVCLCVYVRL